SHSHAWPPYCPPTCLNSEALSETRVAFASNGGACAGPVAWRRPPNPPTGQPRSTAWEAPHTARLEAAPGPEPNAPDTATLTGNCPETSVTLGEACESPAPPRIPLTCNTASHLREGAPRKRLGVGSGGAAPGRGRHPPAPLLLLLVAPLRKSDS